MMKKVLFINTTISWNKGSAAQVKSTIEAVRDLCPNTSFSMISYCVNLDSLHSKDADVAVIGYEDDQGRRLGRAIAAHAFRLAICIMLAATRRLLKRVGIEFDIIRNERICREMLDSDVVIDLSGDSMSDRGSHSFISLMGIIVSRLLDRRVICYSQSIGPLSRWVSPWASCVLNRVDRITVRESISRKYLEEIGVRESKIVLHGDCAFNLSSVSSSKARQLLEIEGVPVENSRLIGVSVSSLMLELQKKEGSQANHGLDKYLNSIILIVGQFTSNEGNRVILVPHMISPSWWTTDDRAACSQVLRRVNNPRVFSLNNDYSPDELKGIIGECEFFVGSRMHACIAALSQGIPTLAVGWSHKYHGIMERLSLGDYAIDMRDRSMEQVLEIVRTAFCERDAITDVLKAHITQEKESAIDGAKIIAQMLDCS